MVRKNKHDLKTTIILKLNRQILKSFNSIFGKLSTNDPEFPDCRHPDNLHGNMK
jgi:hypothetical protein